METVIFLAKLWGFSLVIFSFVMLIRPKRVDSIFRLVENEATLFLVGIINMVLGVALILSYNVWDASWKMVISILAWLVLARGLVILLFPDFVATILAKIKSRMDWIPIALVVTTVLGCFLIFLGFTIQ